MQRMIAAARAAVLALVCAICTVTPALAQSKYPPNQFNAGPADPNSASGLIAPRRLVGADIPAAAAQWASRTISPWSCAAPAPNAVPFLSILDGQNVPDSKHALCPEYPFNAFLAEPNAANYTTFANLPAGVRGFAFIWANRCTDGTVGGSCDGNNAPNAFPAYTHNSTGYAFHFSTPAKADACTLAQTYSYFGDSGLASQTLSNAGVGLLDPANPTIVGGKITDQCYLAYVAQPANVTGVILDYETADKRSLAQAQSLLTAWPAYIKSKGQTALYYGNSNASYNGASPNLWDCAHGGLSGGICDSSHNTIAPTLLSSFDFVNLIADDNASDAPGMTNYLLAQFNEFAPANAAQTAKIYIQGQIGGMSFPRANAVAQFLQKYGPFGGIDHWNNSAIYPDATADAYKIMRCYVYGSPFDCGQLWGSVTGTALGLGIGSPATGLEIANGAPNPAANGVGVFGGSPTNGNVIGGQGSVNDIFLENKSGQQVCIVGTGTTTLNCAGFAIVGTAISFPPSAALVGLTDAQTITSKVISGSSNTLSNIANASLSNSSITFGATAAALGGTVSGLNGVSMGQSAPAAGSFTNLTATQQVLLSGRADVTIAADQNDWNPSGLSTSSAVFVDGGAADRNITGLQGGVAGRFLWIVNKGATNNLVLKASSSSSSAANRFLFSSDVTIPPNATAELRYDGTAAEWRCGARCLANTGVAANTYGSASQSAQITLGVDGRATVASNVNIAIDASAVTSGTLSVARGGTGNSGGAWTSYTPTLTPGSGSFTTATASGRSKTIDKLTCVSMVITITNAGTASGGITATLPNTSQGPVVLQASEVNNSNGTMGSAYSLSSGSNVFVRKYDTTSFISTGNVVNVGGCYENS